MWMVHSGGMSDATLPNSSGTFAKPRGRLTRPGRARGVFLIAAFGAVLLASASTSEFWTTLYLSLGGVSCLFFLQTLLFAPDPQPNLRVSTLGILDRDPQRAKTWGKSPEEHETPPVAILDTLDSFAARREVLIDALPLAAFCITRKGRILSSNRIARDVFGVCVAPGADWAKGFVAKNHALSNLITECLDGGKPFLRTEILRATPGSSVAFPVRLIRQEEDGADTVLVLAEKDAFLDLHPHELVQSQKMQAIGQLAGGIAHDFNNLLTAISGHCDLLLLRHDRNDLEYPDLMQINQNANRAAALVRQLLAFSRKQKMETRQTDVRTTIADLSHLLGRLVGAHIRLDVQHRCEKAFVQMDKRQLEQILMNLVVNSRDAMPNGGEITICTQSEIHTTDWRRGPILVSKGTYVKIDVRDTGCGIEDAILEKIFDPFFTTKQIGEGTGLGLSTVFGIVKQTGGFIFADSQLGQGTTFTLLFPACDAPQIDPPLQVTTNVFRKRAAGAVVLLVEDEAPVRAFASRALNLGGHTVIEAGSGDEALEVLYKPGHPPIELVISDVIMPGRDGPTWVREARPKIPKVPVIFVSGYSDGKFDKTIGELGHVGFLQKPFSLRALSDHVDQMLTSTEP